MGIEIVAMQPEDWPAVREIYAEGIATGNATFETVLPDWARWDANHHKHSRLLARNGDDVVGWGALSPVSGRAVYAGVAEVSVYVAARARGQGVGKALLGALIEQSEGNGIWTLQAGIFPENTPSLGLHRSFGFREVGVRRRIGRLGNTWRDVCLLERRSSVQGV
jgi:L-amino acid N-acyltransferase YncA